MSYVVVVASIVVGVMAGANWLLRAEAGPRVEARPRAIPQKVLDSMERKKPIAVEPQASLPEPPPMKVSPVALTPVPATRQVIREVPFRAQPAQRNKRKVDRAEARAAVETPAKPTFVQSNARSDSPY